MVRRSRCSTPPGSRSRIWRSARRSTSVGERATSTRRSSASEARDRRAPLLLALLLLRGRGPLLRVLLLLALPRLLLRRRRWRRALGEDDVVEVVGLSGAVRPHVHDHRD